MAQAPLEARITVGWDLDMTLVDSRPGIKSSLEAMGREMKVEVDAGGIASRSGPPIQTELAVIFPGQLELAATGLQIFRKHMKMVGVRETKVFPGAERALAIVRELGGCSIVLTAKNQPLAVATLDYAKLRVDEVRGDLWAEQKAEALVDAGAWGYVGDHTKDMLAAKKAGVRAIGVTSGICSLEELLHAGADHVLQSLEEFPDFLMSSR